jgi:hypothetical protein
MDVVCDGFVNIHQITIVPIFGIADFPRTAEPNRLMHKKVEKGVELLLMVGSF